MGIFSKIKGGISSKANAALDKAISPEKELEMAIAELEDGRKKALAELVSYKATAKTLDADMEKQKTKAAEWEKRAMMALRAGDEGAAREALKQKKHCETEATKIERDKHEAASYAIQLNKSRKEFETKLTMLKLRKGTLATQIAAARSSGGNAFGHDDSVWDKFKAAEDRIDQEAIETEVDASMRGEDAEAAMFDSKLSAATASAGLLGTGDGDDPLAALKDKMAADKAAKQKQLGAAAPAATPATKTESLPAAKGAGNAGATTPATKTDGPPATKPDAKPATTTEALPAAKAAGNSGATPAAKADAKPAAKADAKPAASADATEAPEPPRPEVKIDTSKLEAELAALRAALAKGELDDK
jgi:phage shock protein A